MIDSITVKNLPRLNLTIEWFMIPKSADISTFLYMDLCDGVILGHASMYSD